MTDRRFFPLSTRCARVGSILLLIALFHAAGARVAPLQGQDRQPRENAPVFPADGQDPPAGGAEEQLRVVKEQYVNLKNDYARRNEALSVALSQLADFVQRFEECRAWRDEKNKLQTDETNLRGQLSAAEGQLLSLKMMRQQGENEFLSLQVQSEERAAHLTITAEELRERDIENAALRKKIELLEAGLEQQLKERQDAVVSRDEEIARLTKRFAALQQEVQSLQHDLQLQAEIKTKLVQKVRESVSRLMALQSRLDHRSE